MIRSLVLNCRASCLGRHSTLHGNAAMQLATMTFSNRTAWHFQTELRPMPELKFKKKKKKRERERERRRKVYIEDNQYQEPYTLNEDTVYVEIYTHTPHGCRWEECEKWNLQRHSCRLLYRFEPRWTVSPPLPCTQPLSHPRLESAHISLPPPLLLVCLLALI